MIRIPMTDPRSALFLTSILSGLALPLSAQNLEAPISSEKKCVLYAYAVSDAIDIQGLDGLRKEFLAENQAFIDGGCQTPGSVCPFTDAELELANLLTIMTMNEGMASTFVPFKCP